jgi:hypothetical protein
VVVVVGRVDTTTIGRVRRSVRGMVGLRVRVSSGGGPATRVESLALIVGDHEVRSGTGEGDAAAMVQAVVIRTQQHQVVQFGRAAVFPVPQVMGVQTAGGPATGHRAAAVAMLQRATQPAADRSGGTPGADDPTLTLEPGLAGGITCQVSALVLG